MTGCEDDFAWLVWNSIRKFFLKRSSVQNVLLTWEKPLAHALKILTKPYTSWAARHSSMHMKIKTRPKWLLLSFKQTVVLHKHAIGLLHDPGIWYKVSHAGAQTCYTVLLPNPTEVDIFFSSGLQNSLFNKRYMKNYMKMAVEMEQKSKM